MIASGTGPHHASRPRRKLPPGPTCWERLDRATSLLRRVAFTAAFIGALKSVEILVLFPADDVFSVLILAWFLTEKFWLAAGGVGVLALIGTVARLFGPPRPIVPAAVRHTGVDRVRAFGFNAVAAWIGLGVLTVLVMADTRTGPFAWFSRAVLGLEAGVWFATFGLGLAANAAPLVLAALVPRQEQWPVVMAIQDAVRPPPRRRNRPK